MTTAAESLQNHLLKKVGEIEKLAKSFKKDQTITTSVTIQPIQDENLKQKHLQKIMNDLHYSFPENSSIPWPWDVEILEIINEPLKRMFIQRKKIMKTQLINCDVFPAFPDIDQIVNQTIMYHGTNQLENATAIAHDNFLLNAAKHGFLGTGIYLSPDAKEAEKFAHVKDGIKTFLICDVLCGYPYEQQEIFSDTTKAVQLQPPFTEENPAYRYNCVQSPDSKSFCFFDTTQILPTHIVKLKVKSHTQEKENKLSSAPLPQRERLQKKDAHSQENQSDTRDQTPTAKPEARPSLPDILHKQDISDKLTEVNKETELQKIQKVYNKAMSMDESLKDMHHKNFGTHQNLDVSYLYFLLQRIKLKCDEWKTHIGDSIIRSNAQHEATVLLLDTIQILFSQVTKILDKNQELIPVFKEFWKFDDISELSTAAIDLTKDAVLVQAEDLQKIETVTKEIIAEQSTIRQLYNK